MHITTDLTENDGINFSNNTRLSVYKGPDCDNLECYYGDGAIFPEPEYLAEATIEVRVGQSYYIAFDDFWSNKKLHFELSLETPDCFSVVPFSEYWGSHLAFTCWKPYSDNPSQEWIYYPVSNFNEDPQDDPIASSMPSNGAGGSKDSWLVSPGLMLNAGTSYRFSIKYNAMQYGATIAESFRAVILNERNPAEAVESVIGEVTNILQQGAHVPPYNMDLATTVSYTYTPQATGEAYFGLHSNAADSANMLIIYEVTAETVLENDDIAAPEFALFPNPATEHFAITGTGINTVQITDINGRTIAEQSYTGEDRVEMNASSLLSGIYLVKITSAKGTSIKKIIKQ